MLARQGAFDRATLYGLPVVGSNIKTRVPARLGNSDTTTCYPIASAVLTFSELAGLTLEHANDTSEAVLTTEANSAVRASSDTVARNAYVDVDASEEDESDSQSDFASSGATQSAGNSPVSVQAGATTIEAAAPSLAFSASPPRRLLRDSVVLAYRDGSSSLEAFSSSTGCSASSACDFSSATSADELLAVAVDDSRIILRRGGHAKALDNSVPGSRGEYVLASLGVGEKNAFCSSIPLYSTQWKQEACTLLPHAQTQLFRVRPHGGAQTSIVHHHYLSNNNHRNDNRNEHSTRSWCQTDFVALSSAAVSLVHARDAGTDLTPLHHLTFDHEMAVNATCMDDWGPHGTLVGFSDGSLRVVDWRAPLTTTASLESRNGVGTSRVAFTAKTPQPRWLTTKYRNRPVVSTVAGVLSCCSMADSFRVVCGLGDASGTVVVADLRKPDATVGHKRARRSKLEMQRDARLFADVGDVSPTGRAVTDICSNSCCFGEVGLVDVAGTCVRTHLSVLEGTREATSESFFVTHRDVEFTESTVGSSKKRFAAVPALYRSAQRSRGRLPSPPAPWQMLARTPHLSAEPRRSTGSTVSSPNSPQVRATLSQHGVAQPRCLFTSDGSYCVHTEPGGGGMSAVLQPLVPPSQKNTRTASDPLHLRLSSPAGPGHPVSSTSFVSVSSVDRLVCFDMSDGASLSLLLA